MALNAVLIFEKFSRTCPGSFSSEEQAELYRSDGVRHELRPVGGVPELVLRPVPPLEPGMQYEVRVGSFASLIPRRYVFTTGSDLVRQVAQIDQLQLTIGAQHVEERLEDTCRPATREGTVFLGTFDLSLSATSSVGYVIEAGFGPDERSSEQAFSPADPADPRPTARRAFIVRGGEPIRESVMLGYHEGWPGEEVCVTVRLLRHDPSAVSCLGPFDFCLTPADQMTVCAPTPPTPGGCSAMGSNAADAWFLLGLIAWMAQHRRRSHASSQPRSRLARIRSRHSV